MARPRTWILCFFWRKEIAAIILFSNIVTFTIFKRNIIVPPPPNTPELTFPLMTGNKKETVIRHENNALVMFVMFPLLQCKVLTGRSHLKFISPLPGILTQTWEGANEYQWVNKIQPCTMWLGIVCKALSATCTGPNIQPLGANSKLQGPKHQGNIKWLLGSTTDLSHSTISYQCL